MEYRFARRLAVILLVPLLIACGAATPAPRARLLRSVDLPALAYQPGDLPDGYEVKTPRAEPGPMYEQVGIPYSELRVNQPFGSRSIHSVGFAVISLYEDQAETNEAYEKLAGLAGSAVDGLGERANQYDRPGERDFLGPRSTLVFVRCHAHVVIDLVNGDDTTSAMVREYARKIDQRILASPICVTGQGPSGAVRPSAAHRAQ
jgi:hypothetical protein